MAPGKGMFKSTMGYSFVIFLSRVLGLFREILSAQILGGGLVMSAWSSAFLLPNLFRRILGEGALGTALIPLISHTLELEGPVSARRKFSTILIWLTFLLAGITVAVAVPALLIEPYVTVERWKLMLLATPVVMPYCVFICLIGVITSLLNSLRSFVLPALAGLLLNVCLIAALAWGAFGTARENPAGFLRVLSVAVLLSGMLELAVLFILLKRRNMIPELSKAALLNFPAIREILRLALPGLIGMIALQISLLCDRAIAMSIDDNAAAALTYSDRLIYLPIGIFAVAFGTVSLAEMSRAVALRQLKTMLIMMFRSMRQLLFITVPLGVYMIFFGRNLLELLFLRGAFDETALNASAYALFWYAFGIPAFAATKVTVSGFYSRKRMKTPVLVSIGCIILNVILSLSLMDSMKQGGIALATTVTAYLNNLVLLYLLRRELGRMPLKSAARLFLQTTMISGIAGFAAWFSYRGFCMLPGFDFFAKQLLPWFCASVIFGIVFLLLAFLVRIREVNIVLKTVMRRFSRRS